MGIKPTKRGASMAFLDKLMFWKKSDDLGIPEGPKPDLGFDSGLGRDMEPGRDSGLGFSSPDLGGFPGSFEEPPAARPGFEQNAFAQQHIQTFQQQPFQQPPFQQPMQQPQQSTNEYIISKNIEVLSSKLDALRVGIESINQRLAHLERIASGEHEERRRSW